jgi:hypothetical protein
MYARTPHVLGNTTAGARLQYSRTTRNSAVRIWVCSDSPGGDGGGTATSECRRGSAVAGRPAAAAPAGGQAPATPRRGPRPIQEPKQPCEKERHVAGPRTRDRFFAVDLPPQQPDAHKVRRLRQHEQRVVVLDRPPQDQQQLRAGAGAASARARVSSARRGVRRRAGARDRRRRGEHARGDRHDASQRAEGRGGVRLARPGERTSRPAAAPRAVFSLGDRVFIHLEAVSRKSPPRTLANLSSSPVERLAAPPPPAAPP